MNIKTYDIAIVLGSFHKKEMEQMLVFATDEAKKYSLKIIKEVWVPGSMEKPLAVKKLLLNKGIDAVAVLGIIEKGETAHGKTMADAVLPALIELQLEFLKPREWSGYSNLLLLFCEKTSAKICGGRILQKNIIGLELS